jgi:hypothetical protein
VLPKSPERQAIAYTLSNWKVLTRCCDDGDLEVHNNDAERSQRGIAVGRRNWTFHGSDNGGRTAAALTGLIVPAKRLGNDCAQRSKMNFTKTIFWCAGAWGALVLVPMYFMYSKIGKYSPPPATHPEFYYGFVGVALTWQFVFFVIATNPARFRPMIIPSVLEKLSYVIAVVVLYSQSRITAVQLSTGGPDALLGLLFVIAFLKTRPSPLPGARDASDVRW